MQVNKVKDRWLQIIGIPLFALIGAIVFYSDEWLSQKQSFANCFVILFINAIVLWFCNQYCVNILRKKYPTIQQTISRVSLQIFLSTILSIFISIILTNLFVQINFGKQIVNFNDYLYNSIVVLIFVYIAIAIYELNFYFREWQSSTIETEKLTKANLQSQFDSLKNQVSPHFLFNSLNTLSSLIEDDQEKAIQFVNQLSKVYRYLLQNNEKELSTLHDELEFLNAYYFLLKTRFGEGITLDIDIKDKFKPYLLPPLTLQILVENAVKHNIVSVSKPLQINIEVKDENILFVRNNLQKKTLNVVSNGMGLTNISAKYKLLNKPGIEIIENEIEFIVSLPLLIN